VQRSPEPLNRRARAIVPRVLRRASGVGIAQSRVTETTRGTCIYSFVLHE